MTPNVGPVDIMVRIVLGASLLSLALFGPQTPWGYLGIIPIVTGLAAFCPAYRMLGMSTCRKEVTQ